MRDKVFVDTNIFIYLYSEDEAAKQLIAEKEIERYICVISTQVLNEFSNTCIKKLNKPVEDIKLAIDEMINECIVSSIKNDTIKRSLELHDKYQYSYYDCLMISSALENDCRYLLTEDMSDGHIIENKLKIVNIFKDTHNK
jgi:predicted nucleic acid-binding protein